MFMYFETMRKNYEAFPPSISSCQALSSSHFPSAAIFACFGHVSGTCDPLTPAMISAISAGFFAARSA